MSRLTSNTNFACTNVKNLVQNWVYAFQSRHNIVLRQQTGKLKVCRDKEELDIQKEVNFHLGVLKRHFDSGVLC